MPKYSVSCTIHEVILPQNRLEKPIDPLVVVKCFGVEQSTNIKVDKTSVVIWDESFYWNDLDIDAHTWNVGTIDFELQSANAFWRNTILGTCSLQLKLISTNHQRSFSGKLPIKEPNSVTIFGYLTVSVNAYDSCTNVGVGENAITLEEQETRPSTEIDILPLTSPLVCRSSSLESPVEYKYHHLYINIFSLEHLETNFFGNSPYITCEYAGCKLRSEKPIRARFNESDSSGSKAQNIGDYIRDYLSACKVTESHRCNYTFNQCFLIPVCSQVGKPILDDNIIVRIWMGMTIDVPYLNSNKAQGSNLSLTSKLIAEGIFSLSKLRAERLAPRWFNFYFKKENDSSHARFCINVVDSNSQSEYLGRILMSASVKRIVKASNVLNAHVLSCRALEQVNATPCRIVCDVYTIDSQSWFGFDEDLAVSLEISCGPFTSRNEWVPVNTRYGVAKSSDMHSGWHAKYDSIKGRVPSLELLTPLSHDEQWVVYVRVWASGTIGGIPIDQVLASAKFVMSAIPIYSPKSQNIPFWITACSDGSRVEMVNILLTLQRQDFYNNLGNGLSSNESRFSSVARRVAMVNVDYELRFYLYAAKLQQANPQNLVVTVACNGIVQKTSAKKQNTRYPVFLECLKSTISVATMHVSQVASPIPILVSIISQDAQDNVHVECATTHYNRLVLDAHTNPMARPRWLQLDGGSLVLMYSEMVLKSKAMRIPHYQMSPPVMDVDFKLSLLGMRNVPLPENCNPESIAIVCTMQSYGLYNENFIFEKVLPAASCKCWYYDDLWNLDLFTMLELKLKCPIDPIFDPHVEMQCLYNQNGKGTPFGYHAFSIYSKEHKDQSIVDQDLRYNLNPMQVCQVLDSLSRRKDVQILNFTCDPASGVYATHDLQDCNEKALEKKLKRLTQPLQLENIGVYIPPRIIVMANGKSVPRAANLNMVCNEQLEKVLVDIPYSTVPLHDSHPGTRNGLDLKLENSHAQCTSIASWERRQHAQSNPSGAISCLDGYMKYMLACTCPGGVLKQTYRDDFVSLASSSKRLLNAFRGKLQGSIFKVRLCLIDLDLTLDETSDLNLVVSVGGDEFREHIIGQSVTRVINRSFEHDIYVPQYFAIVLKVAKPVFGDNDAILASACIDLEHRWFSKSWRRLLRKNRLPIERVMLLDSLGNVQGSLRLLVQLDIGDQFNLLKPLAFKRTQPTRVQIRFVFHLHR
ncbi:bifunctional Ferlin family/C2 domain/C2 domain superfamily [Babesia duncani]|uniref:Bifunctional Ferlin family/C2 domain/C2 domain superfamily n=1 Tax=Babesia duncani TaxID=323732 RepID=A0AAD9PNP8_9APIC|nr:bifunctional Ferlin family/C2 domain/C2 domain superfamily [Babesia duncani]